MKTFHALLATFSLGLLSQVSATPILQLYIEGSTYDATTETWTANFTEGQAIRLWTIGNVAGEGGQGTISNVRLAIAYDIADAGASFDVTGSQTFNLGGYTDPTVAVDAAFMREVTDGSAPLLSSGQSLGPHGEYGAGTAWSEFFLGTFNETTSLAGDFNGTLPTPTSGYQINVYEVMVSGTDAVHFDLYDGIKVGNGKKWKATFAPFSHDAEGGGTSKVPDGGTTAFLLGLGLISVGMLSRRTAFSKA